MYFERYHTMSDTTRNIQLPPPSKLINYPSSSNKLQPQWLEDKRTAISTHIQIGITIKRWLLYIQCTLKTWLWAGTTGAIWNVRYGQKFAALGPHLVKETMLKDSLCCWRWSDGLLVLSRVATKMIIKSMIYCCHDHHKQQRQTV